MTGTSVALLVIVIIVVGIVVWVSNRMDPWN